MLLRPEPVSKEVPFTAGRAVAGLIVEGLAQLERQAERPAHFSDKALEQARSLANLVSEQLPSIIVRNSEHEALLTKHVVANVDAILGAGRVSYGTVEGHLDALNIHERPSFAVYDARTGRRVECHFGEQVTLDDVLRAVGKRVAVRGLMRVRPDRITVDAHSLRVFPSEDDLPSPREVRGLLKDSL
jgi:hypothetical protein